MIPLFINQWIRNRKLLKDGKKSADKLAEALTESQILNILTIHQEDDFYNDDYIRRRGHALHGHYLWYVGNNEPILPELYYGLDDNTCQKIFDYFIDKIQTRISF